MLFKDKGRIISQNKTKKKLNTKEIIDNTARNKVA
jgi:hypothetical protein